jgi:hypothetical protein
MAVPPIVLLMSCFLLLNALPADATPDVAADEPSVSPINLGAARQQFRAAQEICGRDGGRLWGVSLCGPIMLVNPQSRQVVANQRDGEGVLKEDGGVYTGSLPSSVNISSTPTQWTGVLWTQLIWPLPEDLSRRDTMLAHELFHRIQNRVPIPTQNEAANDHLDTLEGRYWLQLEWRALATALRCKIQAACQQAISDALLFRTVRYDLFSSAAGQENSLELNEGVAEYTGVLLGNRTHAGQVKASLYDLSAHIGDQTFVRSFAYATGPAYGLLLDKYMPGWKQQLRSGPPLNELLQGAAHISLPINVKDAAAERAEIYDGAALRSVEVEREKKRQQILIANRVKFVDGPVLVIPLHHSNVQFNPQNLQPLEKLGTVYPTMRISADWGVLEVQNGALLKPDWSSVSVVAPTIMGATLKGDGWTLELKPNWNVVPAERRGDFALAGPPQ